MDRGVGLSFPLLRFTRRQPVHFSAAGKMAFSTGLIKLLLGLGNLVFFVCIAPVAVSARG